MQGMMIFFSLITWVLSVTKPELDMFAYLLWAIAFVLMYFGWSLFFSITSLIAASSFIFLDLDSQSTFISTALPWSCGICTFTVFISLLAKYSAYLGGNSNIHGESTGFFDGGSDGGGGDGC